MAKYVPTTADAVWNRACYGGGDTPKEGDTALAALLRFHGMTMNGGIFHAVEASSERELDAAEAGYRYFGLSRVASLIVEACELLDAGEDIGEFERLFGQRYANILPTDSALSRRFKLHYAEHPDAYSPVQ